MLELQRRLRALGYWLPEPDGRFGPNTEHAVVALQKVAGIDPVGIFGPQTRQALDAGIRPTPRTATGHVIEVDRTRQVVLFVTDGVLEWVFDTSTGRRGFTTPTGEFSLDEEIDAAAVAGAYRPKYFLPDSRLALHGYSSVPPYPNSHGCVRVTVAAMDWIWASGSAPLGTPFVIYA